MFFNNTGLVTSEMMRVFKPEGRVACLAWGSFDQPFFESTIALVLRLVGGAEMPAQARAMFRFASPGSLKRELRAAGFSNVNEESITVPRIWTGSPQELWAYLQEVSTLCHPLFEGIPDAMRTKVDTEVSSVLARFRSGNELRVPASLIVAAGHRDVVSALLQKTVARGRN